jgi:hypothetical protein
MKVELSPALHPYIEVEERVLLSRRKSLIYRLDIEF